MLPVTLIAHSIGRQFVARIIVVKVFFGYVDFDAYFFGAMVAVGGFVGRAFAAC